MKSAGIAILGLVASTMLVNCGGDLGQAGKHVSQEADKKLTQGELAGTWASSCEKKNVLWSMAGIKSQQTFFNFYSDTGKSIKLFSDENCTTEIGQAVYSGKVVVGAKTGGQESNIIDFDYNKVEVTISNGEVVKAMNLPVTPACGIHDWVAGQGRDVTSKAGDVTCPIAKPAAEYDIAKTDGTTLRFGRVDTTHSKVSKDARPVEIDQTFEFKKQ